jgi:hypothetical protein
MDSACCGEITCPIKGSRRKRAEEMNGARSFLLKIVAILFGALAIISGEADDSPGLQGIGLIVLIIVFVKSFQNLRNLRKNK